MTQKKQGKSHDESDDNNQCSKPIDMDDQVSDIQLKDSISLEVIARYRVTGDIVNKVLKTIVDTIKDLKNETNIFKICEMADNLINDEMSAIYKKKEKGEKIGRGVAFPTCLSVNEICANYCPLSTDQRNIFPGDVVKIALGAHVDGYICVGGHTMIAGCDHILPQLNQTDSSLLNFNKRKGDVIKAAYYAGECALRSIKVGSYSKKVTEIIQKVVKQFHCTPVQNFSSSQMKRYVICGNKRIMNSENFEEKVEDFQFCLNEVYGIDIIVSSGEGKAKESEIRTTVFKRAVETNYSLRTHLSRQFLAEVNKNHPTLPFTVRSIEDERIWKVGVTECMRHDLLHPFTVLSEKPGEFVAQAKFTILLLPAGTKKISGLAYNVENIPSNYKIEDPEIKKILHSSTKTVKSKNSRSKAELANSGTTEENDITKST